MRKCSWGGINAVLGAFLSLGSSPSGAGTFAWRNPPVSGAYNSPSSWQNADGGGGFPGAGDFAIFRFGTYTVTCDGAVAGMAEMIGLITLQLDGDFTAGTYIQGGNPVVLRGGGTLRGGPFTVSDEGILRVEGSGLAMSGFNFGIRSIESRLIGMNGARITSSDQRGGVSRPRLEGGSTWHHTGALDAGKCLVEGGSLLAADTLTVRGAELDHGRLQAGHLIGGGRAINGSTVTADTAALSEWLLEGSGTGMSISGSTREGLLYADVSVKSGAALSAGAIADSAWYTVDGNGSSLAVAESITAVGPQKVTVQNQGQGSAGSLLRAQLTVRGPGSLFRFVGRAEDVSLSILEGGRVNGGSLRGPMRPRTLTGFSVSGSGSALILDGNLELGAFGEGGFNLNNGGRLECARGVLNGGQAGGSSGSSVYGADSFWLLRTSLVVGDDSGLARLSLGEGGRVEVRGESLALALQRSGEGRVVVDGGGSASPSALDTRLTGETGVGLAGKGSIELLNRGRMLSGKLTLGVQATATGILEVRGAGAGLEVFGTLEIGRAGQGRMEVSGGSAAAEEVLIGSNSQTNQLRLSRSGSTFTIAKALHVGETGLARLDVQQGAKLIQTGTFLPDSGVGEASVAHLPGSQGSVTVDGTGSAWVGERGALIVGSLGRGTMDISRGGRVDFGNIVIGGGMEASAKVTVSGPGSVLQARDLLRVGGSGSATAPGELTVSAGGLVQSASALQVSRLGVVRLDGGSAIVGQTTGAAIPGAVIVANQGTLRLGGRLIGSVQLRQGGRFLPGSSPGRATIEGDLTLAEGSALEIELAGAEGGTNVDQIEATGRVTLAGRVELVFRDGFAPTQGQVFEIVRGSSVTGEFSEVEVRGLASGFTYALTNPDGRSLRLTATSAGTSTTPPRLTITRSTAPAGGQVVIRWPEHVTGWTLQQSSAPGGAPWKEVLAPGNSLTVPTTGPAQFFRLAN
jgi:T5SS/PEP-CTERM-associated repeat protein